MFSKDDWKKHCEKLSCEVNCYKSGNHPIDFFDKEPAECKYQQRIAELWIRYYPFRMAQLLSIFAFFVAFSINFLKVYFGVIIIILGILLIICIIYLEKRFTRLQVLIQNSEMRIQYDEINKSKGEVENKHTP